VVVENSVRWRVVVSPAGIELCWFATHAARRLKSPNHMPDTTMQNTAVLTVGTKPGGELLSDRASTAVNRFWLHHIKSKMDAVNIARSIVERLIEPGREARIGAVASVLSRTVIGSTTH